MGVFGGNPAIVKMILERGKAGPEALTDALATATQEGNTEIVDILKAAGAKPPAPADFQVDAETLKSYEGAYEGPRRARPERIRGQGRQADARPPAGRRSCSGPSTR